MKDLKHLIYFEKLLENADNELIKQAQADGGIALGYTCFHIPEVLLNVDKCFSTRLRAPNTGSIDIATYYMSNYTCEYARALVERGIEGGYRFLDAVIGVDACSMMNRAMEHFEILDVNEKPNFFVTHTDMPFKITDYTLDGYERQMQVRVLDRLHEVFGVDTSDAAIRKAVEEHNEVCRIISEISEMRKKDKPVITGYEFHVIDLVTYVCPKALILPYLRETLEELKARKPDKKSPFRARVAIVGSEIDDPSLTRLIEDVGALVVSDRYCFGSTPGREVIELKDDEPALRQICLHYMQEGAAAPRDGRPPCQGVQGRGHHLRADEVLRLLGLRACAGQPHHARRVRLAGALHRPSVQQRQFRPAAHPRPGLCGVAGDQTHP